MEIGIFGNYGESKIMSEFKGPELVDQALWNNVGLAWWTQADVIWSGDNVKISCNGPEGRLRKIFLVAGKRYEMNLVVVLLSGICIVYEDFREIGTLVNGNNKFVFVVRGIVLDFQSFDFSGSINALSVKELIIVED